MNRRNEHGGTVTVILVILLFASLPILAARRRGATVEAWMTGGGRVRGELLAVRSGMLVVHDRRRNSGAGLEVRNVDSAPWWERPRASSYAAWHMMGTEGSRRERPSWP